MKLSISKRSVLVVLLFILIFAIIGIQQKANSNAAIDDDHHDHLEINKTLIAYSEELHGKGYVSLAKGSILDSGRMKEIAPLLAVDRLEANTAFKILKPGWLPKGTKLVGGFPGGPKSNGPWEIISLLYKSPKGEFRIGEARPWSTIQRVIYPKSLINGKTKKSGSIEMSYREEGTGRNWNSIGWRYKKVDFLIQGELPLSVLKKVAESIDRRAPN